MRCNLLFSTVLAVTHLLFGCALGVAQSAAQEVRLLFSTPQDVQDPWGRLHFGATPMQKLRDCEPPGFTLACCLPRADGSWDVYGQAFSRDATPEADTRAKNTWKLVHATTRDGTTFDNMETVCAGATGPWTDHLGLAYNPDAHEFLALKLLMDDNGFGYRAFFSGNGRDWTAYADKPLFYDGDSLGLFWSPVAKRFVCTNKTLQPYLKHIQDHGGTHPQNNNDQLRDRRVLAIRSSTDGRQWEPAESLMDVWNRLGSYRALPAELMLTPDADDPPDLEHYRGVGFWYHDRSYMVVLNYAASALTPRKHAPQLDTEWWVSRDGLKWERPYRDTNAVGDSFPGVVCITHNPLLIDGMILFHAGSQLLGIKQDRISFVGSRANAEFTTVPFVMPAAELQLNAAIPAPERPFAKQQAYVMVGILDDQGTVVPGFEPEKCALQNVDQIDLPLRWGDRSARELSGRSIRLRFYLRSANIYAVTSGAHAG